ncbi:MAG: hypothetical protein HQK95_02380 [Nitrospirae bacterium]|nr:hypothetical protein [Nitrospirota bacterium]
MITKFQDEFFWMLKESKGYYPWVKDRPYELRNFMDNYFGHCDCGFHRHDQYRNVYGTIKLLLNEGFLVNEIIDLFFKSLIRAEIRFISRYVPQRSNEERLTGNLVSEIDNSIHLVKDECYKFSMNLYNENKCIDFIYTDMSRGGKVEKETGADLGFILVLDLPDYPYTVKTLTLQAKNIRRSTQINRMQYETMTRICKDHGSCAYLFYDTDLNVLTSPMVLRTDDHNFETKYNDCKERGNKSFSVNIDEVYRGQPLSLFILSCLLYDTCGTTHSSFDSAMKYFTDAIFQSNKGEDYIFNGRVGVVSLGKKIQYLINETKNDVGGLDIFLPKDK